jgi:membrane protein
MSEEQKPSNGKTTENPAPRPHAPAGANRWAGWIWAPATGDENILVNFCRGICRVFLIVCQEFVRDKIPLRASALTFTVVLAMVPILALGTAVLKGIGVGGEIRQAAHEFIYQLEATADEFSQDTPPPAFPPEHSAIPPGGAGEKPETSLSGHLHRVVDTVFDYVDKTDFATMGIVGILVLMITVYSVLDSIEKTFNEIWQARSGRSLRRKLVDYLALLVVLPLTINFGVAAVAALKNPDLLVTIRFWVPWLGPKVIKLLPVLAVVVTFTTLYSFLPNTKVSGRAALTGGFIGGLGWLLLQAVYFKLQILVVRYNAIYGSFAALPLFLLWIDLSWMIFLIGAEVSFGVQIWRRYLWKKMILAPSGRLGLALEILAVAVGDYRHQRLTTRESLVLALKQPDAYVKELLNVLCRAGVMRSVEEDGGAYVPAAPPEALDLVGIADLLLGELPPSISPDNPVAGAMEALRQNLAGQRIRPRE